MNSFAPEASMLVVKMDYDRRGPNGDTINLKRFSLLAVTEDFAVVKETIIYPLDAEYQLAAELESEDVAADFLKFIDEHFLAGTVDRLLATNMHDVLQYFEQSGLADAEQLQESVRTDIDTLVGVLPNRASLFDAGCLTSPKGKIDVLDMVYIYMYFKQVHSSGRNLLMSIG